MFTLHTPLICNYGSIRKKINDRTLSGNNPELTTVRTAIRATNETRKLQFFFSPSRFVRFVNVTFFFALMAKELWDRWIWRHGKSFLLFTPWISIDFPAFTTSRVNTSKWISSNMKKHSKHTCFRYRFLRN